MYIIDKEYQTEYSYLSFLNRSIAQPRVCIKEIVLIVVEKIINMKRKYDNEQSIYS